MAAAEKFKTPEVNPALGEATQAAVNAPIQEESEEEEEVRKWFLYCILVSCGMINLERSVFRLMKLELKRRT